MTKENSQRPHFHRVAVLSVRALTLGSALVVSAILLNMAFVTPLSPELDRTTHVLSRQIVQEPVATPPADPVPSANTPSANTPPAAELPSPPDLPVTSFTRDQFDMAVQIATAPDSGSSVGVLRWTKPELSYSLALPDSYDPVMEAYVMDALSWITSVTSVTFTHVDTTNADINIGGYISNGGNVQISATPSGVITHAEVSLGCCFERVAYEELAQAMGPLGDHGDTGSIFSQNRSRQRPSAFDAWVLSTIYQSSPGESRTEFAARLELTQIASP